MFILKSIKYSKSLHQNVSCLNLPEIKQIIRRKVTAFCTATLLLGLALVNLSAFDNTYLVIPSDRKFVDVAFAM
jgi:hypothetical protein